MIFNYYGAMFNTDVLSKNQEYYVYRIIDPRNNCILYIGKGKKDRYKTHLRKSHNKRLNNCIQEIRKAGCEPVIEFSQGQTNLTESQAYMREVIEVKIAWNKGQCKCNFANPGPRGTRTGCLHTLETRKKISEYSKNEF